MNPSFVELSLSLKPSYVPKYLSNLLLDLSEIGNEEKLPVLSDYICKHQEELSRVEALKHELPQCRLLLMEAIETLKEEFMNIKNNIESQSEQPDLVEYLSTKRKNNEQEQREITYNPDQDHCNPSHNAKRRKPLLLDNSQQKPLVLLDNFQKLAIKTAVDRHAVPPTAEVLDNNKMSCRRLSTTSRQVPNIQSPGHCKEQDLARKQGNTYEEGLITGEQSKPQFPPPPRNLKAIRPCKQLLVPYKECNSNSIGSSITGEEKLQDVPMDDQYSSRNQGFLYLKTDDRIQTLNYYPKPLTQPIWKNNKRCWSSELHARFVEALNLLGGIQVATPKQIRDLMQVEGLTIDQVKSHLQKYRHHCRMVLASYFGRLSFVLLLVTSNASQNGRQTNLVILARKLEKLESLPPSYGYDLSLSLSSVY
ncbi:transcription factor NIGT1-like [Durio zibethinus]|uniref:Transcription factor NIGT1-like n=1 Tax=Durio zibethinus TaxID=66656 RepID=A0A6P6AXR0_DURZI|nr:transcription factor NIGT1-like [Durio zibethinus]